MAISTPAQKPRGSASNTRSTLTTRRLSVAAGRRPEALRTALPVAWVAMSSPVVVAVAPGSAAERAGVAVGDVVLSVNGTVPRDVIEWRYAADDAEVVLDVVRGGLEVTLEVDKR